MIVAGVLALFAGLGTLSVFLLVGESGRARILVEYEADRIASSLADAFRANGLLDQKELDPRVRGFALYGPDGTSIVRVGDPPVELGLADARPGFQYDMARSLLTLQRLPGRGGPGMMGPNGLLPAPMIGGGMMGGRMMGQGMMGNSGARGVGPSGAGPTRPGAFGSRDLAHAAASTLFLSMDISSFKRSQELYRIAAVLSPFVVAGLAALFLLLLASNIRQRRRVQDQETLARLGESARTLAHEIRNPLSAIRIQTGLLRKKVNGPSSPLDAIDEEVERLTLLSRRVSDFLRNPRGSPRQIHLDAFLRDLSARQEPPVSYSAADEARNATVSFDGDMLRSVVENLVRNAQESYPDEAGSREVVVALGKDRNSVVVAIRDRGKGIPVDQLDKVFDPFFTDKVHGSGVGLSLSRRFVEAAGGSLTLAPRQGGGTEARVTLPAEAAP